MQHAPDIVGNIRIDQAWGLFQISGAAHPGAAHEVSGSYNILNTVGAPAGGVGIAAGAPTALSEISGHPETKWGGSVMNIPTGPGDDIKFDASYAVGDTKNVISTSGASPWTRKGSSDGSLLRPLHGEVAGVRSSQRLVRWSARSAERVERNVARVTANILPPSTM
jgi:Porin subfamily